MVDKFANLAVYYRYPVAVTSDTEAWFKLLSPEFGCLRLARNLGRIPEAVGAWLAEIASYAYTFVAADRALDVLRAQRNTSHAYLIHKLDTLLMDDGLMPNELPDLALAMCH